MKIRIFTIGKKNDSWIEPGVKKFLQRLRGPFATQLETLPSSRLTSEQARQEESERLLSRIKSEDFVILLDERGKNLSSPELSKIISEKLNQNILFIIGGAYGVDENVRSRANVTWSLSRLVFPHQLVRLILVEQIYRAQEIYRGGGYHHE